MATPGQVHHGIAKRAPLQIRLESTEQQEWATLRVLHKVQVQAHIVAIHNLGVIDGHTGPAGAVIDQLVYLERGHWAVFQGGEQVGAGAGNGLSRVGIALQRDQHR